MRTLRWLGVGAVILSCGWIGCSGSVDSSGPAATSGGSGGNAGSAGNAGSGGTCQIPCPKPPSGCEYVGQPTCDPPKCPALQCKDAGVDAHCEIDCGAPPPGCHFVGEPTCNPPKCPPMECVDASADAGDFPANLDGIWLIGWSGGMNHFSWVRISGGGEWGGDAVFLADSGILSNVPFWSCSGAGTWAITQKINTIAFYFPSSCTLGMEAYTFLSFDVPSGGPPKATLHATIEGLSAPGQTLEGYRFPLDQCDAAMTTCKDPWQ